MGVQIQAAAIKWPQNLTTKNSRSPRKRRDQFEFLQHSQNEFSVSFRRQCVISPGRVKIEFKKRMILAKRVEVRPNSFLSLKDLFARKQGLKTYFFYRSWNKNSGILSLKRFST